MKFTMSILARFLSTTSLLSSILTYCSLIYHVGNIRRELTKQWSVPVERKIVKMINETFAKQAPIAKSKVKTELQRIYDDLGVKQRAKAADLNK